MIDVDETLPWLASVICMPRWPVATKMVVDRTEARGYELNLLRDRSLRDVSPEALSCVAEIVSEKDAVLAMAWKLLALRPTDARAMVQAVVADATALISSTEGDVVEALARLRVWDAVAHGKVTGGGDFFQLAEKYWRGERQYMLARRDEQNRVVPAMPPCVELLACDRWDDAFAWLAKETARQAGHDINVRPPPPHDDRKKQADLIKAHVESLFGEGRDYCGDLALAWQMLLCDPRRPHTFNPVMPQLAWALGHRSVITNPAEENLLRARLHLWWEAAAGKWDDTKDSVFAITGRLADKDEIYDRHRTQEEADEQPESTEPCLDPVAPTVVVMPKGRAEEKGLPQAWKDLRDEPLPLVVCRDAAEVRERLQEEYPYAWREVAMLTQDLRSGEPARIKPTLLLSRPGIGKTRLIRRLAENISPDLYVSRFDAASAFDGMYGGTPKGWTSAHPSVPARAVLASRTANPIVLVDEIEKASESTHNGNLWSAMTPLLERETSQRHRESGLDAELDLSHVIHLATANSVERLPSQLRDRFRVIKIPAPTLAHLPKLAALVMRDLAAEDDARAHDKPLAADELEIIGRAWAHERFSIRKLQRLVGATLETRDACARRH
ncbi:AAA ATPase central region [Bradyrhizobium sp.]|uniref:AAA family ATPase n=1 Tax=Bradyrhizobium sp. TaxID=376 RepID=UPI0007C1D611|nr:AAA family ATPase [Bradyrhizobium sp.]CUT13434.1 AAA ATPase central region [Bradyrhizobium sp.]